MTYINIICAILLVDFAKAPVVHGHEYEMSNRIYKS